MANTENFGNQYIRQNVAAARAHTLRNFISKITMGDLENQPKPEYTFIHEYEFMVTFMLADGKKFEGVVSTIADSFQKKSNYDLNKKDDKGKIKKEDTQNYFIHGDYISKFLDQGVADKDWDFYLKSIDLPNIQYGSGRTESLDEGQNTAYGPGMNYALNSNGSVTTDEQEFTCIFYDTELSFIDGFLIPWMQDIANPRVRIFGATVASGSTYYPESTKFNYYGTIILYQISSVTGSIVREWRLRNCRPKIINTPDFDKEKSAEYMTREVVFIFDRLEFFNYTIGNKVKTLQEKRLDEQKSALAKKKEEAAQATKNALAKATAESNMSNKEYAETKAKEKTEAAAKKKKEEEEKFKKEMEDAKKKAAEDKIKAANASRQQATVGTSSKQISNEKVTWWDRNNPFA